MKSRLGIRPIDVMVFAAIGGFVAYKGANRVPQPSMPPSFAQQVDLKPLERIAVQADGRLRSFESHAKTYMGYVSGPRSIDGQSNGFTYLDLVFRPEHYADKDLIYVKNKNVRGQILEELAKGPNYDSQRSALFFKHGLISRVLLAEPSVRTLLQRLGEDLIRTAKVVDSIQSALTVCDPRFLSDNLRVVASPSGDFKNPWLSVTQLIGGNESSAGAAPPNAIPGLPEGFQPKVREAWSALRTAWRSEDAGRVNEQIANLAALFPTVSPHLYPEPKRLSMESWYFRNKSMTWVWWLYAAALAPLLISVIYKWNRARTLGMVLFVVGFLGHTASLAIRWYVSGRWPNSNMFEAVHTSAWLGGAAALILEWIARRAPLRNLFALGSSMVSMAALMAAYFLPAQLDSTINNKMAALNDVWLYIHTNMIILSYALIGLACVTALLLLRHRWCAAWDEGVVGRLRLLVLPIAVAVANYTGYLLLLHVIDRANRGLSPTYLIGTGGAFFGSMVFLLASLGDAVARSRIGPLRERAAAGGAASMILGSPQEHAFLKAEGPTTGQIFDGATMVLLELSFITLWTGIVMGAIWADHSWGRPWGWDPKEVFALNTFIVFLILVHVRLKVRDKGLWTAVLAVVGFEVMMFNWIVVNFIISGLHSYA